jgi:hypothetical protein
MSPRSKPAKSSRSEAASKGWITRRRNERAEAARKGWITRRRNERAEARTRRAEESKKAAQKQKRREAAQRAAITRRTRKATPPAISGVDKWTEDGITFFKDRETLYRDHPAATSRRLAAFKEDAANYVGDIGGKAYFAIVLVVLNNRTYYQPFFRPDMAGPTKPPRKRKDTRKSAKYRKRSAADEASALGLGLE